LAAGRVPDGRTAYETLAPGLDATPSRLDLPPEVQLTDPDAVLRAASQWLAWCRSAGLVPARNAPQAWQHDRHEYRFTASASTNVDTVRLAADEHLGGGMDWYSFDATTMQERDTTVTATATRAAAIPVPASFPGMPDPRW